jgi:hypothetical protein
MGYLLLVAQLGIDTCVVRLPHGDMCNPVEMDGSAMRRKQEIPYRYTW